MGLLGDLRILYHLVVHPGRATSPAERLEQFYHHQAESYDAFRQRFLHGRREMIQALALPDGGCWLDLGGGTGHNLEYRAEQLPRLRKVTVVDLCPSLLRVAIVNQASVAAPATVFDTNLTNNSARAVPRSFVERRSIVMPGCGNDPPNQRAATPQSM
jgi:hypothetical protein